MGRMVCYISDISISLSSIVSQVKKAVWDGRSEQNKKWHLNVIPSTSDWMEKQVFPAADKRCQDSRKSHDCLGCGTNQSRDGYFKLYWTPARCKRHRRLGNKIVTSKRRDVNQRLDHRYWIERQVFPVSDIRCHDSRKSMIALAAVRTNHRTACRRLFQVV